MFCVLLLICCTLTGCRNKLETAEIDLGGRTFTVEIARTPQERARGLMDRKELAPEQGMLFIFEYDQKLSFWMKDTYIPLSIAFITVDKVIVDIQDMEPLSNVSHIPAESYRYALEVNKGYFQENGIAVGDAVEFQQAEMLCDVMIVFHKRT